MATELSVLCMSAAMQHVKALTARFLGKVQPEWTILPKALVATTQISMMVAMPACVDFITWCGWSRWCAARS